MQQVSPFTFLVWKEDKQELVAAIPDTSIGYIVLLTVDGIDVNDIVKHITAQGDAHWQDRIAQQWPTYIQAVAAAAGKPSFLDTGMCEVEYADINTGEVLEITVPATASSYNESVRVETARAQHDMSERKKSYPSAEVRYKSHAKGQTIPKPSSSSKSHEAGQDDSEDEYEDVTDEEEEEHDNDYMEETNTLRMLAAQMESAISLADGMGMTEKEINNVYASVVSRDSVPKSVAMCAAIIQKYPALKEFTENFTNINRESIKTE